jgi:uncharacterized protein with WD repeat
MSRDTEFPQCRSRSYAFVMTFTVHSRRTLFFMMSDRRNKGSGYSYGNRNLRMRWKSVKLCHFSPVRNVLSAYISCPLKNQKIELHGLSPRPNYTDRATAAYLRSNCQLFADRGCHVASVTDHLWPYSRFSRQEPLLFYKVAPQLYSRGWVDPVPDTLPFFW